MSYGYDDEDDSYSSGATGWSSYSYGATGYANYYDNEVEEGEDPEIDDSDEDEEEDEDRSDDNGDDIGDVSSQPELSDHLEQTRLTSNST